MELHICHTSVHITFPTMHQERVFLTVLHVLYACASQIFPGQIPEHHHQNQGKDQQGGFPQETCVAHQGNDENKAGLEQASWTPLQCLVYACMHRSVVDEIFKNSGRVNPLQDSNVDKTANTWLSMSSAQELYQ